MLKFWLICAFIAVLSAQFLITTTSAAAATVAPPSMADVINDDLRQRLIIYNKFLSEEKDSPHEKDLLKLIKITEGVLANENVQEKQTTLENLAKNFTDEFNAFVARKTEGLQINNDIQQTIDYYRLLSDSAEPKALKDEIETIIKKLQTTAELKDIREKVEQYFGLEKTFSKEFQKLLRDQAVLRLNRDLQKNEDFLEKVLKEGKYESEIKAMIEQIQTARKDDVTAEQKQEILQKVTNPQIPELFEYLRKKFIELN